MALNYRVQTIHAELESTYGVDPTLVAADAIKFIRGSVSFQSLAGNRVSIDEARASIGSTEEYHTNIYTILTFDTLLSGAGTAVDNPPKWQDLMEACGTAETVNATTSVDYDPVSSSFDSVYIQYNMDGQNYIMAGSRGTVEITWAMEGVSRARWTFWGRFAAPSSAAALSTDFTGWQGGIVINDTTWQTTALHGQTLALREFSLNLNNNLVFHPTSEGNEILITGRRVSGDALWEKVALSTFNPESIASQSPPVNGAFSGSLDNTGTGQIVEITSSQAQIVDPREEDLNGVAMTRATILFNEGASGNDEVQITTR